MTGSGFCARSSNSANRFPTPRSAHLHPHDIGGAIVSLSEPRPPGSWKWGGPDWHGRSVPGSLLGVKVGVAEAAATRDRWLEVAGGAIPAEFVDDPSGPGIFGIELDLDGRRVELEPGNLDRLAGQPQR